MYKRTVAKTIVVVYSTIVIIKIGYITVETSHANATTAANGRDAGTRSEAKRKVNVSSDISSIVTKIIQCPSSTISGFTPNQLKT
jgi:hypothetical protein